MNLTERQTAFRDELVAAELLFPMGAGGLYGRSAVFERIVDGIERQVTVRGQDMNAVRIRYPSVIPTDDFDKTDYLASFPHLTGSINGFQGGSAEHAKLLTDRKRGKDWRTSLTPIDLMLVSAACHPVFPMLAGDLPTGGRRADVLGHCFRHEPSVDPARMQAFRQREYVYVGEPDNAIAHREEWTVRSSALLAELGLVARQEIASDPFFGRAGRMLAVNQKTLNLKTELVVHLYGDDETEDTGTAVVSCNYHVDHFGASFGIRCADGEVAHSACVGFGLERIALALLRTHGFEVDAWPVDVRTLLFL